MPYYWNYTSSNSDKISNYQELMNSFHLDLAPGNTQKYDIFQQKYFPNTKATPFQGTLFDLLLTTIQMDGHRLVIESTAKAENASSCQKKQKNKRTFTLHTHLGELDIHGMLEQLNSVYIHCMNQNLDNANSQSAIISFKMPSLGMRFVCTGDAHDETFHFLDSFSRSMQEEDNILDILRDETTSFSFHEALMNCKKSWEVDRCLDHALTTTNEKLEVPIILSEEQTIKLAKYVKKFFTKYEQNPQKIQHDFTTLLILPHHGSSGNISRKMLELFNPSLLVISAGNGVLHGHPETETINSYKRAKRNRLLNDDLLRIMKHEPDLPSCIAYSDKREAKQIGHLVYFSKDLPLLSTNIHGNISFDKDGVYSDFSNIVEYKNILGETELFSINFRKKIEDDLLIQELNELHGSILKRDNAYFYKLISRGHTYYYNAVKLE